MLQIKVIDGKIEKALKKLKHKVRNTKQTKNLRAGKTYTKISMKKRDEKSKAIYKEKLRRESEE